MPRLITGYEARRPVTPSTGVLPQEVIVFARRIRSGLLAHKRIADDSGRASSTFVVVLLAAVVIVALAFFAFGGYVNVTEPKVDVGTPKVDVKVDKPDVQVSVEPPKK